MSLTEFRKSINSVLYERTTSPLYGTFVLSWLICNWKIVFACLFENQLSLGKTRIAYILEITEWQHLILFPFLSTTILILIVPFAANGAYWASLKFKKWRTNMRNVVEEKQLLTIEQSLIIREEMKKQEAKVETLLKSKDSQLDLLNRQIESLTHKPLEEESNKTSNKSIYEEAKWKNEFNELENEKKIYEFFEPLVKNIRLEMSLYTIVPQDILDYYEVNNIINAKNRPAGYYGLTAKGNYFHKIFTNKKFGKK